MKQYHQLIAVGDFVIILMTHSIDMLTRSYRKVTPFNHSFTKKKPNLLDNCNHNGTEQELLLELEKFIWMKINFYPEKEWKPYTQQFSM